MEFNDNTADLTEATVTMVHSCTPTN